MEYEWEIKFEDGTVITRTQNDMWSLMVDLNRELFSVDKIVSFVRCERVGELI